MLKRQLLDLLQDYPDDAVISLKVKGEYKPVDSLLRLEGYHDIEHNDYVPECGGHLDIIAFIASS